MPDSEDPPPPLQPQDSSSSGKRKRNQDRTLTDAELRKKRKRTLKTVAKKMGDSSLFSKVLVFAVEPDGELYSFAFPAAFQDHIINQDLKELLQSMFVRKPLSQAEKTRTINRYGGDPPTCKVAFQSLNTNTLRMLLRCMDFLGLQKKFTRGEEEDMPEHMRTHLQSYVFLGEYLDADNGWVSEHKFEGKNQQNGRFQAQNISDEVLSQSKNMWKDGPCPHGDNPQYTTFETIMSTKIKAMSRPMLVIAVGIHLECVHAGESPLCTCYVQPWFSVYMLHYRITE